MVILFVSFLFFESALAVLSGLKSKNNEAE